MREGYADLKKPQQLRQILTQTLNGLRIRSLPPKHEALSGLVRLSKIGGMADALEIPFHLLLINSFNVV
jgi:hypothetical protein